jgi:hypothetical protein
MPQGGFWETFGEDDLSAYEMRELVLAAAAPPGGGLACDRGK